MGQAKYIYFTDDNLEQLKRVDNMSKLINDLLTQHFKKIDPETMSPEEIKKMIAVKKAEIEHDKKIKEINENLQMFKIVGQLYGL